MVCMFNELKNLLHNKKIFISFLLLVVFDIIFFAVYLNADSVDYSVYKKMCESIKNEEISVEGLLFENAESEEAQLIYKEYQAVNNYDEYLKKVKLEVEESGQISIFQNAFSLSNIEKTGNDYAKLKGIKPVFAGLHGMEKLFKYPGTVISVIIFMMLLSAESIIRDKKNGLLNLYKTTANGDGRLIFYKFCASVICMLILFLPIYIINFSIAMSLYGKTDMSLPVQSIYAFQDYGYILSIGQFIVYDILARVLGMIMLLAIAFLICMISSSEVMALVKGTAVFVAFIIFSVTSKLAGKTLLYRFFSLSIFNTEKFFGYLNYNVFNKAINAVVVDIILYMTIITFCLIVSCIYYMQTEMYYKQIKPIIKSRRNKKVNSILTLECKKLFWGYKIIYVILLYVACIVLIYSVKNVHWGIDEFSYKYYMTNIEGEVSPEKKEYLEAEERKFDECKREYEEIDAMYGRGEITETKYEQLIRPINEKLSCLNGFEKCKQYTLYIDEKIKDENEKQKKLKNNETNIGYVYNRGIDMLIGNKSYKTRAVNAFAYIIFEIILLSFLFLEDYRDNIIQLVSTSYNYDKLKKIKWCIAIIINICLYIMVYGTELIWIWKNVGINNVGFSIYSLYNMRDFPFEISIINYFICLNILRILIFAGLSAGYVAVYKWIKRKAK